MPLASRSSPNRLGRRPCPAEIAAFQQIATGNFHKFDTTQGAKRNTDQYEAYQAEKSLHDIIMAKWEPGPLSF